MPKVRLVWMALAAAAVVGSSGCPKDDDEIEGCTLMGCESTFEVTVVQDAAEPTEDGAYTVTVTPAGASEREIECQVGGLEEGCGGSPGDLTGSLEEGRLAITAFLEVSGDPPETVEVRVESGGVLLGEETFSPDYSPFYPNGEECDEEPCYSAEDTMIVDSPPDA